MGDPHTDRRGARIAATFWIGVEGVDERPSSRRGNLSVSGMFFECQHHVGAVGSMQFLHIESEDHGVVVQVLARVSRIDQLERNNAQVYGLAVQFMPSSAKARHNLERLVRHVVEIGLRPQGVTPVAHGRPGNTSLRHLDVRNIILESDKPAELGDQFEFRVATRSWERPAFLTGQVIKVGPFEDGYRVQVRITNRSEEETLSITDTSEELSDHYEFHLPDRDHLSGQLSRIKVPTLLGLFEMERMSGELRFKNDSEEEVTLFLQDGRLIDGESNTGGGQSVPQLLSRLMKWKQGQFNFVVDSVQRQDKVQTSTTNLLLDLAREEDHESRYDGEESIDIDVDFS